MADSEEFLIYLANVEEFVFDENKIVSIGWLSKTLNIGVGLSKKLLFTFTKDESFKSKISTCWFLYGSSKTDPASRKMLIVPENELGNAKYKFEKITSQHVYSIQKCGTNCTDTDINSVYLADQSTEKTISQCTCLSNIKCEQVKIVSNRRNLPTSSGKSVDKVQDISKKSPRKNTIGSVFGKKEEDDEKKEINSERAEKETENSKKGAESNNEEVKEVTNKSPAKKSTSAGKKKGPEKKQGSANITSFFPKCPPAPTKKIETITSSASFSNNEPSVETNTNKETSKNKVTNKKGSQENSRKDHGDVMDVDENVEPVKVKENGNKEKKIKDSKSKNINNLIKSSNTKKDKKETERKRIKVFSDSSDSELDEVEEREQRVSSPPPSLPCAILSEDEDDVIPSTPEPVVTNGRKRKRRLVTKTMTDESGFLRTVKEFEIVSCSDSEGESNAIKQDIKKQKIEEKSNSTVPIAKSLSVPVAKSPIKSKQTSILNFFKKSA